MCETKYNKWFVILYFGEQRDKESDYFAMGFRLYDPEIGRFLAIDPLLDIQPSQTPYHYCFNNPTSFTDPTGLYPEKEKDRVQAWVSRTPENSPLMQHLAAPRTATPYEETKSFMRDKWEAESWALNSEPRYNGGGGGSSGRTGTKVGSMSYSINGVEGKILYRYNDDQDKEKIEKKIKAGLDWQCKDVGTRDELIEYFIKGYELKVDVSISGTILSDLYDGKYGEDTKYLNGIIQQNWLAEDPDNILLPPIPELEFGCIYIASEHLNDGPNRPAGKYLTWESSWFLGAMCNISYIPVDFNLSFSHETGHRLDYFNFFRDEINVEGSAKERTMRQYEFNNNGRKIRIP